jgi:hypothetical protein
MNFHTNCNHCNQSIYAINPHLLNDLRCSNCKSLQGKSKLWFIAPEKANTEITFSLDENEEELTSVPEIEVTEETATPNYSEWWLG